MFSVRWQVVRLRSILVAGAVLAGVLAGCGSGNVSQAPPPPQQNLSPTISSFSPTSGAVGATLTLTGTNFTGATSVTVGGVSATFSVSSATSVTLTVPSSAVTGKISLVTPHGTATSVSNFTVSVAAPTLTNFSPTSGQVGASVTLTGTNFTGATAVKFNGTSAAFSVTDASHISTSVPTGATSGTISVTTPGGTATSASSFSVTTSSSGLDLTIDGLYITQATQNYPAHDVGLIAGRSAWVRVFVLANQTNTATPQVRVSFVKGSTTNTLTINAPGSSVPTSVDITNSSTSWNMAVPSAWITSGTTVSADVDPTNQIPESNKGNNHFAYGALTMATVHQWKTTLFPIHTTDGRTGTVENASRTKTDLVDIAKRLYPVPDSVDVVVGATFNSSTAGSSPLLTSSGTNWDKVLSELLAKRTADGVTDRTYVGFVNVSYTSGVAGLGYIGAGAALVWDVTSTGQAGSQWVLAHETGHNFGRQHSPCGGASNPDLAYPYPGGTIGVPGWDVFASSGNLKPTTDTDIMGYCSNQWISDYVYKSVLSFRSSPGTSYDIVQGDTATSPTSGLLVWGRVEGGRMILEPAFQVTTTAAGVPSGPFTWEAKDARGQVVTRVPFQMLDIADLPNQDVQHFAFIVPMDAATMKILDTLRVVKGASEVASQKAKTTLQTEQAMSIFRISDLGGRRAEVHWDPTAHPVVMLRDGKTGEVRGFLRGGDATIEDAPDNLELQLSDGVRSRVVTQNRPSAE